MADQLTPAEAGRRLGRDLGPLPLDVAIEVVHVLDAPTPPADRRRREAS